LDALRLAWSANARFERGRLAANARARGQRIAGLEDDRRDAALSSLEKALSLTQRAAELLAEDADKMDRQARRWRGHADPSLHGDVAKTEAMARGVERLLKHLTRCKGIPQIRTQGEWDEFLSESAAALLDAGFANREVAALLTGQRSEDVDRATMERFRQRVRRIKVSGT
jgi:hypothetical protein